MIPGTTHFVYGIGEWNTLIDCITFPCIEKTKTMYTAETLTRSMAFIFEELVLPNLFFGDSPGPKWFSAGPAGVTSIVLLPPSVCSVARTNIHVSYHTR